MEVAHPLHFLETKSFSQLPLCQIPSVSWEELALPRYVRVNCPDSHYHGYSLFFVLLPMQDKTEREFFFAAPADTHC